MRPIPRVGCEFDPSGTCDIGSALGRKPSFDGMRNTRTYRQKSIVPSAMAYDCYLAICNTLLYNVLMSQRLCHVLGWCGALVRLLENGLNWKAEQVMFREVDEY
ncbi:hypothetical protein E2I00_004858 [Balaenoptera physalus]|uniref:Uncharacterized protein n=1 Tax=Balaenoptera physalus TaxID=9770 RepID=A0A643AU65_BALPH|nr:hypothetical protein E2I00_004858 [Balaenoptera physalus]